jgi:hypothetical protein
VTWPDMYDMDTQEINPDFTRNDTGVFPLPGGVAYLSPAVMLFGLDPGHDAVSYPGHPDSLPAGGPATAFSASMRSLTPKSST